MTLVCTRSKVSTQPLYTQRLAQTRLMARPNIHYEFNPKQKRFRVQLEHLNNNDQIPFQETTSNPVVFAGFNLE